MENIFLNFLYSNFSHSSSVVSYVWIDKVWAGVKEWGQVEGVEEWGQVEVVEELGQLEVLE